MGSKKAAVLPDPVMELAKTSRPNKIGGIANCWTVVGFTYPRSSQALRSGLIIGVTMLIGSNELMMKRGVFDAIV